MGRGLMLRLRRLSIPVVVAVSLASATALASGGPLTAASTPAQRAAILRAFRDPAAADRCLVTRLAEANHSYATVRFRRTHACRRWAFNGVNILKHTRPAHWRIVFEGSAFSCPLARIPRAVQADLCVCSHSS